MIVDQELDAVIRAGVFRDREHAIHEAIETLFSSLDDVIAAQRAEREKGNAAIPPSRDDHSA